MKTDALIEALARGPVGADTRAPGRRLGVAVAAGAAFSLAAMLALIGPRADLATVAGQPLFWTKLGFPLVLAGAALAAAVRLSRPGQRATAAWSAMAVALCFVEAIAILLVLVAPVGERLAIVAGRTALPCVASIVALALPILLATVIAMRGMAPTRPRTAGLAAGLVAGALAATIYALHCDESTLPFLAVWYVLGMAIPGALAALAGPRILRWA